MNYILPFTKYCKNFIWNIFHSLINYFFYIHVKGQHNINHNCYLFINNIGRKNKVLINYINYSNTQFFKNMEIKNIKLELNSNRKIPIIYIKDISISPKIFRLNKIVNVFRLWSNSSKNTQSNIYFFEEIYNELIKYIFFKSSNLEINYNNFRFLIKSIIITKNNGKIRIFIKKLKIITKERYITKLLNLKISYDLNTDNINIYCKDSLIYIDSEFIRNNTYGELIKILDDFSSTESSKLPNIYFNNVKIIINIQNYVNINIKDFCFENNIAKLNANVKLWKKEVIWINRLLYNNNSEICLIDSIRLRLFNSTADKLYKSFRPIIKKYFFKKIKKIQKLRLEKYKKPDINTNYCNNLIESVITSPKYIKDGSINYSYMSENEYGIYNEFLIIKEFKVNFEPQKGNFEFDYFKYSKNESGWSISSKKWLFYNKNIRYLDTLDIRDIIKVEFKNNSMYIHTYKLYLNLDIEQYSKTFSMFAKSIDRILDIFTFQKNENSYIFDKFYMCSFRTIFSYSPSTIDFTNLFTGNYNELLNLLDLTDMDIILKDNTISYPRDFQFILHYLIKNIIEDVIDNNFETVIKKTPVALSYKFKNALLKVPKYASKVYNTINHNI